MSSLCCTTYQACDSKIFSKAIFYCIQCDSLQCISCEKQIHNSSNNNKHERLDLNEIADEYCSINKSHPAVFHCSTCTLSFCYSCYKNKHQHSDGREHKLLKSKEEQTFITEKDNEHSRIEAKPFYPPLSSDEHNNNIHKQNNYKNTAASTFADIELNNYDEHYISPSQQQNDLKQTKTSTSTISQQKQNTNHIYKQEKDNEQLSDADYQRNQLNTDSNEVFLLLNAQEHLTVNNELDFIRQLKSSSQDPNVKCISIIGNTGDGKSYTLNQVFFNGKEKFHTSSTTESCTMGVWAALDENQRTLILDTEGRLGLSQNDNIRNRLLLKILCVSDIIIFRTRAPKLPNDMFQFLSDASNAFLKIFRRELENVMKNCKVDGPMSTMGPTLIVFHETQFTEVLRDSFQCQKTAVEQLKERFEKMNLSYDAYSSIEYVGTQTLGGNQTDFNDIKATITATLENNKIRSPRRLSVIFKALKALNEKFNHAIPPEMPSTLPDEFFACHVKCASCGIKCTLAANHQKENISHQCDKRCSYNKELDNEVWKCLQCHRDGRDIIVYGKLITKSDGLVQGLLKYVWSGFVIECSYHGEIYRSRKYWYGNNEPKDVTRVEVVHVWPGEDNNRVASDVTPRKVIEVIRNAGSYISAPTKVLTEKITDQIAPSYWVPNKDVNECLHCKLVFGSEHSKHHCRACGNIFCDTCTTHRATVPLLDIKTFERVCDQCYDKLQSPTLSSAFQNNYVYTQRTSSSEHETTSSESSADPNLRHIPMSRRFVELATNNVGRVIYDYTIKHIKESTRPNYWRPDNECHSCFICNQPFNNTTHRLHHCRKCGEGICDICSPNKRPVPEREWFTPERVYESRYLQLTLAIRLSYYLTKFPTFDMQAAEKICLWKYQYKSNENSPSSPMNNISSSKGSLETTSYLMCTERLACDTEMSSKATYYCTQCNSLQCILCEKQIHENSDNKTHERLNLDEIEDEYCSIDRNHPAVFYCPNCTLFFCYPCYENKHQYSDEKNHRPQKSKDGQNLTMKTNVDQRRNVTKPIQINSPNSKERPKNSIPSSSSFEDVKVDDSDENYNSPPIRKEYGTKSKISNSNPIPKQHNLDEQMLLESMLDNDSDDQRNNHHAMRNNTNNNRLPHKSPINTDSNGVFLLLNAQEHLTVNNELDFIRQLKSSSQDPNVKCISIIGNTGDGKSYTLNQVFFNGKEKFHTSSTTESCTMGVWAALDENQRTLILDTEGRLGLSQNDNIRNRLLLKILCISDIIIFRTRAPKLPNDMFQFLSDASNAFLKFFRRELENVMKNCKVDGPMSTMGPTLIVFHETQFTEVLRDHLQCQKTAVEQLKERFEKMNLSYDAYSSIEYVGTQTLGGKQTDFSDIKATITATLENNKIRSPRRLSVIFKALKALNEKFNHAIPPEMPSTLPDDFFACHDKCASCGIKCTLAANHQKENISHQCDKRCSYNKELDNEVWKCLQCHRDGRDIIVYGKLITKSDGLVQGLLKYVWSGFVIECPYHGEIYRSRKYWYGNNEPKDVTRVEVVHVWPGEDNNRVASDVTPRKFMEMVVFAGSYISAPTKMLTEMVADQIAPSYWVPNKDVNECSHCKLIFGSEHSKHHCRACGHVFCDTCTTSRRVVPWIDADKPVRVCDKCYANPQSRPPSAIQNSSSSLIEKDKSDNQKSKQNGYDVGSSGDSASTASSGEHLSDLCLSPSDIFDIEHPGAGPVSVDIPASRRVYETFKTGLEKIGVNYPIELIKESTRPNYWRPDHECRACFICKRAFNSTTNRLHHCRNCGDAVCEQCSPKKRPVPERDWLTPVRVCKSCNEAMNESTSGQK